MVFITDEDLKTKIRDNQLNMVINNQPTVLDAAESTAIATVKDALVARFDIDHIFSQTGVDRPAQVIQWVIYLMLYDIYNRIPDASVPKRIIKNYDDTLMILMDTADGKRSVDLQRLTEDEKPKTKFRYGSTESDRV